MTPQQRYYLKNKEKISEYNKIRYQETKDKVKDCYQVNKEKFKNYYQENKEKISEYNKIKYQENRDKILSKTKKWNNDNKEKKRINNVNYRKKRLNNDANFKLKHNIRSLINQTFKNKKTNKPTKSEIILGCSFETFKNHIESLWEPWMNWDNYGNPKDGIYELNKTWDIDHIIPSSIATTIDEIIKLNHYTNLQPLCSYTNRFIKKNLPN
jgi:hypothetical protein